MKPFIGITMGDPAGIGPEIIAKAANDPMVFSKCNPVVVGESRIMEEAVEIAGVDLTVRGVQDVKEASYRHGVINVYDLQNIGDLTITHGKVNADLGRASGEYIEKAVELALSGEISAMVTAPINKESFSLGGYGKKYRGHTEMLASLTESENASMMLVHGNLRVIHVATHVSMRRCLDLIKTDRIYRTIQTACEACRQLGVEHPKIGVAGFNPHCGDGGIMGDEEVNEIIPAIEKARSDGLNVDGPIPADTIFPRGKAGAYCIIVAMYHDQGHIPVKLLGFEWGQNGWSDVRGTNITVGLPIVRTSVDHGTAYGKAGKGLADEKSLLDAIHYAVAIAEFRLKATPSHK
jgi:4-hydroxythreonine-4-phosphate dehydrogenase